MFGKFWVGMKQAKLTVQHGSLGATGVSARAVGMSGDAACDTPSRLKRDCSMHKIAATLVA